MLTIRRFLALAGPFWFRAGQWREWVLLAAMIGCTLGLVRVFVLINAWNKTFYDALAAFDSPALPGLIGEFLLYIGMITFVATVGSWLRKTLLFRWRAHLTGDFEERWLDDGRHYRLQITGEPDNPDQRIAEDILMLSEKSIDLFKAFIQNATKRVSITSPYFVPDEALLSAMTTAAYRGVEVELFVGRESDHLIVNHAQRSYYQALLASGVRIYRYPAPTVLHAKYMTVDDEIAIIGSANMDFRSFALNYEVMLLAFGGDLDDLLRANDAHYRSVSPELTAEEWAAEPWWRRYIDNVCRLLSAVL